MTFGADAVGGVLSTVVVPVTVDVTVFVSARPGDAQSPASNINAIKNFFNLCPQIFLSFTSVIFIIWCKYFYTYIKKWVITQEVNNNMKKQPDNFAEQEYIWEQFDSMWGEIGVEPMPTLPVELERFEIKRIKHALDSNDYNRTKTAEELGIGRTCLIAKLRKYDLLEIA
tara:strand:- start:124 stop:633 length:510 start_codon:yes stop_codon:yes gene_type:complete